MIQAIHGGEATPHRNAVAAMARKLAAMLAASPLDTAVATRDAEPVAMVVRHRADLLLVMWYGAGGLQTAYADDVRDAAMILLAHGCHSADLVPVKPVFRPRPAGGGIGGAA